MKDKNRSKLQFEKSLGEGNRTNIVSGESRMSAKQLKLASNLRIERNSDHTDHFTLFAFGDGSVVGYVDCSLKSKKILIRYIHVNREYRRQGIAAFLIANLVNGECQVSYLEREMVGDGTFLVNSLANNVSALRGTLSMAEPANAY